MLNKTQKASENEIELGRSRHKLNIFLLAIACFALLFVVWAVVGLNNDNRARVSSSDVCLDREEVALRECIQLEIVRTPDDLAKGLSGRSELNEYAGMLFDFRSIGRHCMWMKDMAFSLDMVWIDAEKRITAIQESVAPESFPETFCGTDNDRYVLEINNGVVDELGIAVGQLLRW